MYFDTHCHLNFKRFEEETNEIVLKARMKGVNKIVIPGTDTENSRMAVELAEKHEGIYAAVGIHPHHINELGIKNLELRIETIQEIQSLLQNPKVKAVGEVGLDKHTYKKSKYGIQKITEEDIVSQKELLIVQIRLALEYDKSVILHNREATEDVLGTLNNVWDKKLEGRTVFHCCESDERLLDFSLKHRVFLGVDGDVTYDDNKQEFVRKIPLESLVVETDSPYLLPEPLRSQKKYPNEPAYLPIIVEKISEIKEITLEEVAKRTYENSIRLFNIK
jgi:TatD DNase family protein